MEQNSSAKRRNGVRAATPGHRTAKACDVGSDVNPHLQPTRENASHAGDKKKQPTYGNQPTGISDKAQKSDASGLKPERIAFLSSLIGALRLGYGLHVDETAAFLAGGEHNHTVNESIDGMILTHAHVQTGMVNCATLTFDNIARFGVLTAKNLHSESFAF